MEIIKKINIKNFNLYTILSILVLLAGIFLWIDWIVRYGILYDLGIYSLVIVFIIAGIIGFILSLLKKEEVED
ncbi:MAG: hypothetical protein JSU91_03605 [Thermoplasmatales archaeon]|nr:MAG: hypothetical protein JSU91_03605 [Thermoplasmatales archaeon]